VRQEVGGEVAGVLGAEGGVALTVAAVVEWEVALAVGAFQVVFKVVGVSPGGSLGVAIRAGTLRLASPSRATITLISSSRAGTNFSTSVFSRLAGLS